MLISFLPQFVKRLFPQKRKPGLKSDAVTSRAVVPKKRDPRQPALFDRPLPAFAARSSQSSSRKRLKASVQHPETPRIEELLIAGESVPSILEKVEGERAYDLPDQEPPEAGRPSTLLAMHFRAQAKAGKFHFAL
jgi:hypothetical protein